MNVKNKIAFKRRNVNKNLYEKLKKPLYGKTGNLHHC